MGYPYYRQLQLIPTKSHYVFPKEVGLKLLIYL